jgi:hypothetical protein
MFRPPSPAAPLTPEQDRRRVRRQLRVMGGLFLTLAGLLFSTAFLPDSPGALYRAVGLLALALGCVWIGGILLGSGTGGRGAAR